jgi:hypothetical protein
LFNGANLLLCKTSAQTATKVVIGLAAGDGLPAKEETFLFPADNTIAIYNESGHLVLTYSRHLKGWTVIRMS